MRDAMNATSGPGREVDEFAHAGDRKRAACETIRLRPRGQGAGEPGMQADADRAACPRERPNFVVFGEVTGVHLRDDCLKDGIFDVLSFNPLSRMGYRDYTVVRESFSLSRPGE
jgi:hypothetical protein